MNKYVLRTSLVWIALITALAAAYFYRGHAPKQRTVRSGEVQPVAVGPRPVSNRYQNAQCDGSLGSTACTG